MSLRNNLIRLRAGRGISRQMLADWSGVHYKTIANYESGARRDPSVYTVAQLAYALRVSVEELIRENDD